MYEEQPSIGECANGDIGEGQNMNNSNPDKNNEQQSNKNEKSSSAEGSQPAPASADSKNKRNDDDDDDKKLFVGGLAHDATEEQLRTYFSKYGEVSNINIKSDLMTKKPRGFAFVTFSTCEPVIEALKTNSHTLNGKQIDPKKARARPKPPPMKKIFVGGLSPEISEQEIIKYFEKFGKVENVELPYDKVQSKRRAFCFVCFETEKAAQDAAAQPKQLVAPMTKQCDVKIATPPKPDVYGFQPMFAGRGRDRFYGGFGGFNYGNGYGQNLGTGGNFNQNYGYNNYGSGYDYYNSGGYNGGYSGSNYDTGYWNYNQNNYGGGYGDSQCSDDYTRDTM